METPLLETETASPSAGVDARGRQEGGRERRRGRVVYFACERAKRVHVEEKEEERTAERKREVRSRREKKQSKHGERERESEKVAQGGNDRGEGNENSSWRP